MEKKQNVPALRFQGFSGKWSKRTLENMCDIFTDGDWIEANDQSDTGIRLIQTGNIGIAEYIDKPEHKKWISKETFDRLHCTAVLSGDILISRLPDPAGRACIIPELGMEMITVVDCTIVRVAEEYSKEYLVQYLSTHKYFAEVKNCLAGGTRQRISRGNLSVFSIPVPTDKTEQDRIGKFFERLDDSINVKKRKIQKLQQFRQTMLAKLFPREGAAEPELRFRGFSGAWRENKIADIAGSTYGGGTPSTLCREFWQGNIPWIQSSDILLDDIWRVVPHKHISKNALKKSNIRIIPKNSIAIVIRVGVGKLAFIPFSYTTSQDFLSLGNLCIDSAFATCAIKKKMEEDILIVQGTSIKGVTKNEILNKTIMIPQSVLEQQKIGNFFKGLDSFISLQQKRLERMQRLKAALLEKMFV